MRPECGLWPWARVALFTACLVLLLPPARPLTAEAAAPRMTLAFYDPQTSNQTILRTALNHITDLAPTGVFLTADATLQVEVDERTVTELAHSKHVRVFPMVQNYRDGAFRGEDLRWLSSAVSRRALAAAMLRLVVDTDADGINLDFEELPQPLRAAYVSFVGELSSQFHSAGKKVLLDLPVARAAYDAAALASVADWLVLMAYDEHNLPGQPGAVASYPWATRVLRDLRREVSADRIILGLGVYGYDWGPGRVEAVSFREALNRAGKADMIKWDAPSRAPRFTYTATDRTPHTIWFSDAASLQPLIREARQAGLAGISLWRLGLEDPGLWNLVDSRGGRDSPEGVPLQVRVSASRSGEGQVAQASQTERLGKREVSWDREAGVITEERYLALPEPQQIRSSELRRGMIALTFDDGPDPRWTPRILDILKAYGARATFFVVGSQAVQHPELLARMHAEGHEIGNHTYTHSRSLEVAPEWRFSLELNSTERVIEAATGHSATLFRYPYTTSLAEPQDSDQAVIERPARYGYRLVGQSYDTLDWARPGSEAIVSQALADPERQVLLMHDGGGDRSQTVVALPTILSSLRARGLRSVPVSEAVEEPRQSIMPAASRGNIVLGLLVLLSGWVASNLGSLWLAFVAVVLLFVFARIALLGVLGLVHWIFSGRRRRPGYRGPVTVLIAAHNEVTVIARTLEAVLGTDSHPELEIIVVDDGSDDGTAAVVSAFADRGVRLIRQPQSGKASALRTGFASAHHPVVVALDADTLFTPSTIGHLVRPFSNSRVGAVAGNPKVGNRVNLLTWFQVAEYVLTLNLERRAYALLGCVPVVPGAVGAWRLAAVQEVAGFSAATLAEDTDITLALARRGYRVTYAPRAVAYTEAPQTLRGLSRQRSRWAFGMLQCLWKHRRATFSPRAGALGMIVLPGMWSVQLVLPLLAPTIDIGLLLAPFLSWSKELLLATAAYNGLLIVLSVWALAADREPVALALLVPLQNLFYRQFLYVMALKAVVRAFRGVRVGWNPVARLGTSTIAAGATDSRR